MSTKITVDQARHVAELARLRLSEEELAALTGDLAGILDYVAKLDELDTSAVEPTTHAVELATVLRHDAVTASLPVDRGLGDAPERIGDGFGVPQIIE